MLHGAQDDVPGAFKGAILYRDPKHDFKYIPQVRGVGLSCLIQAISSLGKGSQSKPKRPTRVTRGYWGLLGRLGSVCLGSDGLCDRLHSHELSPRSGIKDLP